MFSVMFALAFMSFLFWIGFKLTGAVLLALVWLFIKLPLGVLVLFAGVIICCTVILIPAGVKLIKIGFELIIPGVGI